MSMTRLRDLPPELQDRYGYRRTPWPVIVVVLVIVIVLVGYGSWAALRAANPDARWEMLTWSNVNGTHTDITWEVRRSANDQITCALRVQGKDTSDLGYALVDLPAGTDYVQETYSVATNGPAHVAEVLGCAKTGSPLNVPEPAFAPGTTNPPQPWRQQ